MPRDLVLVTDALEETWRSFDGVLSDLSDAEWARPTGCPGWDVKDNVSHVIGVELMIDRADPAPGHVMDTTGMSEAGVVMEPAVDYRRGRTVGEVLAEFRSVTASSLERRRAGQDADPDQDASGPFGWRLPLWRLLGIRVFDCFAHEQDVRRAVEQPGNLDGLAADVAWENISVALPGGLPRRVVELAERPVELVVDGREPVRIGGKGDAVAVIEMDFAALMPFVCGRADADPEAVIVLGDQALGGRVLAEMGFTP